MSLTPRFFTGSYPSILPIARFVVMLCCCFVSQSGFSQNFSAQLDSIYSEDQTYRLQLTEIQKKYGIESKEVKAHWQIISVKDSVNLVKVSAFLDQYGWPGYDVIGKKGSTTLFLVIQHADLLTQEKYLPLMREAVDKGSASMSQLALLEDRVAIRQGKRQIYGSQIGWDSDTKQYYVQPLDDPDNVDKRRAKAGLQRIAKYLENWQLKWDVEQYKKELPAIEAKEKLLRN